MSPLSFTLILSGVLTMAAAYPPDFLREIYSQAFGGSEEDNYNEESTSRSSVTRDDHGDHYDGIRVAMLQEMLREELGQADTVATDPFQEVSSVQGTITGPIMVLTPQ